MSLPRYTDLPSMQFDAWVNLRGDLDKVQMGVATPDQLRGTYAAANAPSGPPPPPPPRGLPDVPQPSPRRDDPSERSDLNDRNSRKDRKARDDRNGRHESTGEHVDRRSRDESKTGDTRDNGRGRGRTATNSPSPPPPPPPREGHLHLSVQLPFKADAQIASSRLDGMSGESSAREDRGDRMRPADHVKSRSPSPRSGGGMRRSPGRSFREGHRSRDREGQRERERQKDRKRKRDRERDRDRDRGRARSRESDRRGGERLGREYRRWDEGDDERGRWGSRGGR